MPISQLGRYIERLTELKEEYRGQLDILIGLEVDYIRAFEHETKAFLDQYGTHLDDSILSVHFLPAGSSYICLDYDEKAFQQIDRLLRQRQSRFISPIMTKSILPLYHRWEHLSQNESATSRLRKNL